MGTEAKSDHQRVVGDSYAVGSKNVGQQDTTGYGEEGDVSDESA
jgi:hypothetical protein